MIPPTGGGDDPADCDDASGPDFGPGPGPGPAPTALKNPLIKPTGLNLTMSVETLLQIRNDPGYLDNFGFIPDHLREGILTSAATVTVLVLNNCGTLLDLGKTVRFPNTKLAKYLQLRDVHCRMPGCGNDARLADLDHQQPFKPTSTSISPGAGSGCDTGCSNNHTAGETCGSNMAALSRSHHLLKHHTKWQVQHCPDHTMIWTTPNGHRHTTTPYDWRLGLPTSWISDAEQQLQQPGQQLQRAEQQPAAQTTTTAPATADDYPDDPPF